MELHETFNFKFERYKKGFTNLKEIKWNSENMKGNWHIYKKLNEVAWEVARKISRKVSRTSCTKKLHGKLHEWVALSNVLKNVLY